MKKIILVTLLFALSIFGIKSTFASEIALDIETQAMITNSDEDDNQEDTLQAEEQAFGDREDQDAFSAGATRQEGEQTESDIRNGQFSNLSVNTLLTIAGRNKKIETRLRDIIQGQIDSGTLSAEAVAHMEARSKAALFLWGKDHKALATLRAQIVLMDARIQQLRTLASETTNVADKAELLRQAELLNQQKIELQATIDAHTHVPSMFGWFVGWFHK